LILQAALVVLDFVEILYYTKVSLVDSKARILQTRHCNPHMIGDLHIYTLHMRDKVVSLKFEICVEH